jgi:hypothetical protein
MKEADFRAKQAERAAAVRNHFELEAQMRAKEEQKNREKEETGREHRIPTEAT